MSTLHDPDARGFASDNAAGMHPDVLTALVEANGGHVASYGGDPYTSALTQSLRTHFGPRTSSAVVLTGTGANVVALQALTRRWESVLASDQAHVLHDEAGGLEHVGGTKVIALPTVDGLVDPADVERAVQAADNPMRAPVGALTLTQSTELGTTYSVDQLRDLVRVSHGLGVRVHVDGARLANAAVSLGLGLGEFTTHLGVDAVSVGGTKNGGGVAEAVVVGEEHAEALRRLVKPSMQQSSKTRFVSAQLLALFGGDLWRRTAGAANAAARDLAGVVEAAGAKITRPVQANGVFAELPPHVAARAAARVPFHVWDPHFSPATVEVRLVASFDTTAQDVARFGAVLAEEFARG
ncbi:threonine aldolase family protein [Kineococcus rhizosphaerae]|uniref:L-threonine aldolase n=1 Tax=Kineococcus rhizosphaerae TaxID=559628 RepID=A0A2T0QZ12_9ACTN|nr:beta-eliminating lyase-related protein [Kineococcus rhizosphaerae]PRY11768.1 L-threonine aldolase [Kineococcus rhizosphaerae]